jgi:hypothetical protein
MRRSPSRQMLRQSGSAYWCAEMGVEVDYRREERAASQVRVGIKNL